MVGSVGVRLQINRLCVLSHTEVAREQLVKKATNTHIEAHNCPVPRDWTLSSDLCGQKACMPCADIHEGETHAHIK